MGRTELRNAIFDVVEYLTQTQLSERAKKLILYYFNESRESETYERAIIAIERYYSDHVPSGNDAPARLRKMLSTLKKEADVWDAE